MLPTTVHDGNAAGLPADRTRGLIVREIIAVTSGNGTELLPVQAESP